MLLIVGIYSCYDDVNRFFFVQLCYSLRNGGSYITILAWWIV